MPASRVTIPNEDSRSISLTDGAITSLDSLSLSFRKPRLSPPKKRTVQLVDALEDTALKPRFETVNV